jgi:two-component system chemotaxis response regulator CheY
MKTCLVIDDSEIIREIAARIIGDTGVEPAQADNAGEAIEICRDRKIDAVLLDWDLPHMGALDFLRGAASLDADKKPEIILVATENDPQQFTLAKAAGAAHHILKPFDRQSVHAVLAQAGIVDEAPKQNIESIG